MYDEMTTSELQSEIRRAAQLADICAKHGHVDGQKAHEATKRALEAELDSRG